MTAASKSKWFELRYVGPIVIAVACLWDAGMRFFPERLETFRAWESALILAAGDGEFRQNYVYDNPRAYGDLSNLANCDSCKVYRRERFTTDAYGFRNSREAARPYNAVLVGDSFGVGSSLSDEDTLSRQLDRILPNTHIYNASAQKPQWSYAAKTIERKRIRGSFLIWEHAQLHPFPSGPIDIPLSRQRRLLRQWNGGQEPEWYGGVQSLFRWTNSWLGFSPLKMAVQKELRHAEMQGLLPSGSTEDQVKSVTLVNGQTFLNYQPEIEIILHPSKPDLDFFRRLKTAVQATGNELIVVLIPTKLSVYGPLMRNPPVEVSARSPLAEAADALNAADIRTLDLTPVLRREAAVALQQGQLIYHVDDTHWNAAGVRVGAAEIAKAMQGRSQE